MRLTVWQNVIIPHVAEQDVDAAVDAADAPVIMVGPGTGIAPFRAFMEERAARGATGRNWLFFGDQHEATDFLYRDQLLARANRATNSVASGAVDTRGC